MIYVIHGNKITFIVIVIVPDLQMGGSYLTEW